MNPFYKIYCRIFQKAFKLAIPLLPYRDPKVITDTDLLPAELKKEGVTSVLLVTDETLYRLGMTDNLRQALSEEGIACHTYHKTVPNPTIDNVEEAKEIYLYNSCNGIIGFGGGSSIDCAKAVAARIARPKKSIPDMGGILKILFKTPFLIAVPTTAGTGSEVTVTTVITDSKSGHKFPISDFPLIPSIALLDPKNTKSMPASITSTTGMDALTHAVEAYIGNSDTRESRRDALECVSLVFDNIEKAYTQPHDLNARENMMRAAYLGGRAFSRSYVGYIHAVAHSLGGKYNIPHGLANAVLLPVGLEIYMKKPKKKYLEKLYELSVAAGTAKKGDDRKKAALSFINAIKELNCRMGIPDTLTGIAEEDIPEMAVHAVKEANPIYPVPVLMNEKELEIFYRKVSKRSI